MLYLSYLLLNLTKGLTRINLCTLYISCNIKTKIQEYLPFPLLKQSGGLYVSRDEKPKKTQLLFQSGPTS